MDSATPSVLQWQLTERRERLATAVQQAPKAAHLIFAFTLVTTFHSSSI